MPYGSTTSKVHDYRTQKIKDILIQNKKTYIVLKKRRYVCKNCGKRFFENLDFLPKYLRITNRLFAYIINELSSLGSMSSIASKANISFHTVKRIFDMVSYSTPDYLPEVISIDEFIGNSGNSDYHCIIVDPVNHKVIDIIKDRKLHVLCSYFKKLKTETKLNM